MCPGKFSYILKIFVIFLCLGVISGIVFYLTSKASTISTSVTITVCGNMVEESGEECDDGNASNTDACLNDCTDAACGDNYLWSGVEECDDGNTTSGDGCSSSCEIEAGAVCGDGSCNGTETCSSCVPDCGSCGGGGGGGGGGGITPPTTTKVILQGKTSPAAYLTSLKDGQVIANTQANSLGDFKVEISNMTAGVYTFGIWSEDKSGLRSITFSFTTNVASGTTTTISGIFIPPTISLSKESVRKGETLNILGYTAPQSEVEVHINSDDELIEKVFSGTGGSWFYNLDTNRIEEGIHSTRAKASTTDGLLSTFSQTLLFGVGVGLPVGKGACPNADLNKDGRVNLIDFSILLFWWGKSNECADQNSDGIVNLIDFSIMLYYWTG